MWLIIVRVRGFGESEGGAENVRRYNQLLADHFSHEAEDKMEEIHGIKAKSVRARYLKDLFIQWRGAVAAYDEGLVKGDAVLAAAVWRNLWSGRAMDEQGGVDWRKVGVVVGWIRRVVKELDGFEGEERIMGAVQRGSVFKVREGDMDGLVRGVIGGVGGVGRSKGVDEKFKEEDAEML
jgi:cytochrome b pre-mRNA-processing protein 3